MEEDRSVVCSAVHRVAALSILPYNTRVPVEVVMSLQQDQKNAVRFVFDDENENWRTPQSAQIKETIQRRLR